MDIDSVVSITAFAGCLNAEILSGLGNHAINRVMPAIKSSGNSITAIYSRAMKKAEKEGAAYGARAFSDLDEYFSIDFQIRVHCC